jgi:hypothetical protein
VWRLHRAIFGQKRLHNNPAIGLDLHPTERTGDHLAFLDLCVGPLLQARYAEEVAARLQLCVFSLDVADLTQLKSRLNFGIDVKITL